MLNFEGTNSESIWQLSEIAGEQVGVTDTELLGYARSGRLRFGLYPVPGKKWLSIVGVKQKDLLLFLDWLIEQRQSRQQSIEG